MAPCPRLGVEQAKIMEMAQARTGGRLPASATWPSLGASFRDPAGFVFEERGIYKRAVTLRGQPDYDLLRSSGLYDALVERGLLVAHAEEPRHAQLPEGIYKVLVPEQIRHISYCYEWSFTELRDAARLTLEVQSLALQHGMTLKDASAYNVQFRGPAPIFIDTLSFERNQARPWAAYGQFCGHFLAPLALMSYVSPELRGLWRSSLDGVPLALASRLLPARTRFRPGLLLHLHWHARSIRKYSQARGVEVAPPGEARGRDPQPAIVDSLGRSIAKLTPPRLRTEWLGYYDHAQHYSRRAESFKRQQVARVLADLQPEFVYDLGGNVGEYSRLATAQGIDAICYDFDPICVDRNYLRSRAAGDAHMLPLVMDLANPSPRLGFDLEERLGFFDRAQPPLVLALALLHHLRIAANVPLERIARFLGRLGERLLIEFVPLEDPMAQTLLGNRPDIYGDYTAANFRLEFERYFELEHWAPIPDTLRSLHLYRRRR
jgi:hypothetical protein